MRSPALRIVLVIFGLLPVTGWIWLAVGMWRVPEAAKYQEATGLGWLFVALLLPGAIGGAMMMASGIFARGITSSILATIGASFVVAVGIAPAAVSAGWLVAFTAAAFYGVIVVWTWRL